MSKWLVSLQMRDAPAAQYFGSTLHWDCSHARHSRTDRNLKDLNKCSAWLSSSGWSDSLSNQLSLLLLSPECLHHQSLQPVPLLQTSLLRAGGYQRSSFLHVLGFISVDVLLLRPDQPSFRSQLHGACLPLQIQRNRGGLRRTVSFECPHCVWAVLDLGNSSHWHWKGVTLYYGDRPTPALNKVSFKIESGMKVGIVGIAHWLR